MAETTELNAPNVYNRELILDLTLNAFYLYDFGHADEENVPKIHDYIKVPKTVASSSEEDILDSSGVVVTDDASSDVTRSVTTSSNRTRDLRFENFKYLTTQGTDMTLTEFTDYSFADFTSLSGAALNFDSYLITGQDLSGDFMRKKQAIYILVYNTRTETIYSDIAGVATPIRQSSCLLQTRWDWNDSDVQGKFGLEFETYRFLFPQPLNPVAGDVFDYGPTVIETKNKIRGSGKSLSLKFTSSPGKDTKLLGWGILGYKVDNP